MEIGNNYTKLGNFQKGPENDVKVKKSHYNGMFIANIFNSHSERCEQYRLVAAVLPLRPACYPQPWFARSPKNLELGFSTCLSSFYPFIVGVYRNM